MKKLLLIGNNSIHVYNYYYLIKDYFSDVLLLTNELNDNYKNIKAEKINFSLRNPLLSIKTIKSLRRIYKDYNPDVVHIHQAGTIAFMAIKARGSKKLPIIVTAWGSDILQNPKKSFIIKRMVRYILRNADSFTSPSNHLAEEMAKIADKNPDIVIANFGINIQRDKIGKKNIIYSNRLHTKLYRIDIIIKAFAEFTKKRKDEGWKLIIAGNGEETENLKKLAAGLGISKEVEFKGWVNKEENSLYNNISRLYISIPMSDGVSISMLEAMAAGCIPIVSDLPSNKEWINNGENGLIANVEEKLSIESALMIDAEKAAKINNNIIESRGTQEANKQKFIGLYDRIISKTISIPSGKISVCHISTVHRWNDTRIFYKECKTLSENGYIVNLVITYPGSEKKDGVVLIGLNEEKNRIYRMFVKSIAALKKALETKSHIYHFHDPELIFAGLLLKICGKKVIYDIHENVPEDIRSKAWIKFKFLRYLIANSYNIIEKIFLNIFDCYVCATPEIASRFSIKKAININNYPVVSMIDKIQKSDFVKSKFTVIYAGELTKIRGLKELVDAMVYVGEKAELWLIGKWEDEKIKRECENSAGYQYIRFFGFKKLDETYSLMKAADIGIINFLPFGNHLKAIPNKAFEYMSCGLPMILSDFDYWKEIFAECSIFTNSKNPEDIAEKILFAANNIDMIEKLGIRARKMIEEKYSWETEAKKLLELYNRL